MSEQIPTPPSIRLGKYRHYKGKEYEVIGIALHSESLQPMVVYVPLYESASKYWVRPYDMFTELIEVDGKNVPRFAYIQP